MQVGPTNSEVGVACDGEHLKTQSEQVKMGRRRCQGNAESKDTKGDPGSEWWQAPYKSLSGP